MIDFIINNQIMHQYIITNDILYKEEKGIIFYKEINFEEKNLIRIMDEALFGIEKYFINFNSKSFFIEKSYYLLYNKNDKIYESIYFRGEEYDFSRRK